MQATNQATKPFKQPSKAQFYRDYFKFVYAHISASVRKPLKWNRRICSIVRKKRNQLCVPRWASPVFYGVIVCSHWVERSKVARQACKFKFASQIRVHKNSSSSS